MPAAPRQRKNPPSYRLHRPTGQAVVTLNGKDLYLGRHGSPESQEGDSRLVAAGWRDGRGHGVVERSPVRREVVRKIGSRLCRSDRRLRRGQEPAGQLHPPALETLRTLTHTLGKSHKLTSLRSKVAAVTDAQLNDQR